MGSILLHVYLRFLFEPPRRLKLQIKQITGSIGVKEKVDIYVSFLKLNLRCHGSWAELFDLILCTIRGGFSEPPFFLSEQRDGHKRMDPVSY